MSAIEDERTLSAAFGEVQPISRVSSVPAPQADSSKLDGEINTSSDSEIQKSLEVCRHAALVCHSTEHLRLSSIQKPCIGGSLR